MKIKAFLLILFSALSLISACSPLTSTIPGYPATTTLTTNGDLNPSISKPTQTLSPSPTFLPSLTPTETATPFPMVTAERIPVIEYHNPSFRLNDNVMMKPEWFEDQMNWLSVNGYYTLSGTDLVNFLNGGALPQKSVALSFDMGVARHTEYSQIIIPTLRKYGLKAIVFLVVNTNLIGDDCGQGERFCWSELKSWSDEGLISVESHGIWHQDYKTLDINSQKQDAGDSKRLIEENIGKPVHGFAYPYDSVNKKSFDLLRSLGYEFALAGNTRSDRSVYLGDSERYNLPRLYPYSNPASYPHIGTRSGKTFDQLIQDQTALVGLPAPIPTQTDSPDQVSTDPIQLSETPVSANTTPNPAEISSAEEYLVLCNQINTTKDQALRVYQLNHILFPIDLSPSTQAALPFEAKRVPSCNARPINHPLAIILHFTRGPLSGAINTFQKQGNTSAHYIIDRDGSVYQVLPENLGAYHVSCYGLRSNCVPSCPICDGPDGRLVEPATQSIGIELVNQGQVIPASFEGLIYEDYSMSFNYRYWEDYPESQIRSLVLLVNDIRERWGIPLDMVMGHYRVNTNSDPGPALNLFWTRYGNPSRPAIFPSP